MHAGIDYVHLVNLGAEFGFIFDSVENLDCRACPLAASYSRDLLRFLAIELLRPE